MPKHGGPTVHPFGINTGSWYGGKLINLMNLMANRRTNEYVPSKQRVVPGCVRVLPKRETFRRTENRESRIAPQFLHRFGLCTYACTCTCVIAHASQAFAIAACAGTCTCAVRMAGAVLYRGVLGRAPPLLLPKSLQPVVRHEPMTCLRSVGR